MTLFRTFATTTRGNSNIRNIVLAVVETHFIFRKRNDINVNDNCYHNRDIEIVPSSYIIFVAKLFSFQSVFNV